MNNMQKSIVSIVVIVVVGSFIVAGFIFTHKHSAGDVIETTALVESEYETESEEVDTEPIEVPDVTDDEFTAYPTQPFELNVLNTDPFVEANTEQIYEDFTNDGRSILYREGIYLKSSLEASDEVIQKIIKMLEKKKMPKPYRIDSADTDEIYIIYNGRGYMFRSDGSQVIITEDEEEDETTLSSNETTAAVEETSGPSNTVLEEPEAGLDAEDAFREQYGDLAAWVQSKVDGFKSSEVYIHPYKQLEDGEWVFYDSRDKNLYHILYDTNGNPMSVEYWNKGRE